MDGVIDNSVVYGNIVLVYKKRMIFSLSEQQYLLEPFHSFAGREWVIEMIPK